MIQTGETVLRPDGHRYPLEMVFDGGKLSAFEDDAAGLLRHLIHDYDPSDEKQAGLSRARHALEVQVAMQPLLTFGDPQAFAALTEDEWRILDGSRDTQPKIERWDAGVPLILVDLWYAPYTGTVKPVGERILWLRPLAEDSYLRSLHEVGYISLSSA